MRVFVCIMMALSLVSAQTLSEQELELLSQHVQALQEEQLPEIADYTLSEHWEPRIPCSSHRECPLRYSCIDIPSALYDVLNNFNALIAYSDISTMMGIRGGECAESLGDWINDHGTVYFSQLTGRLDDINEFVNQSTGEEHLSSLQFFGKMEADPLFATPIARSSQYNDPSSNTFNNILPLFLLLQSGMGSDSGSLGDDNGLLIYFLLMSEGMTNGGAGSAMAMNPLFLLALTSSDSDSSSADTMQLILLMSLFNPSQGMGSVMPFFLINALGDNGSIEDILPILLMSNMFGDRHVANDPLSQLLPLLLMNMGGDNSFLESFLLMTLVSSINGQSGMGVGQDLFPLLLIMSSGNSSLDSNFLMTFLMITFFGGSNGANEILPLLMLLGDGGIGGSNMDISTLAILMSLGNLGAGGISSLLPILLMNGDDESSDINDIILISLLRGTDMMGPTGDIINLLIPILLTQGSSGLDSNFIVMLMLFSSQQKSGVIASQAAAFSGIPGQVTSQVTFQDQGFEKFLNFFMIMSLVGDGDSMDMTTMMMVLLMTSGSSGIMG